MNYRIALATFAAALAAQPALAYVGPGAGLSLIGSVVGLLAAIGTALGFVLFWPIRSLYRRLRGKRPGGADAATSGRGPQP